VLILTALLGCGCRGSIETDAGADANADDGATQDSGTDAADSADPGWDAGADPGTDPGTDEGIDAGSDPGPADQGHPVEVLPEDVILLPPETANRPILGTITGYEMSSSCDAADDPGKCELPLYRPYDRDTEGWWDNLVEELIHSRVHVIMAHGRGCFDPDQGDAGNGNMCPRLLRHLVQAIDAAGARDVVRLGMWDDTGAYPGTRNTVDNLPADTPFDLADPSSWRFFWDHNMKIWFDTVPSDLWLRMNGRPVVAFWSLADAFFANQQGNASLLLRDLRAKFIERYQEDPLFIVDQAWVAEDTTITPDDAQGVNDWFGPPGNNCTYRDWGGGRWGAAVPGFRDPNNWEGCGTPCREVPRRDGDALRDALNAGASATFVLLEGFTDIAESAGYYRSPHWRLPNLYLNIIRDYADPGVPTLRFEAEAADGFSDLTAGNTGGAYRDGDLDVGPLPGGHGWFVGWTDPGEWLEFLEVGLRCGGYRFTARYATPVEGVSAHLEINGVSLGSIALPATGSWDSYQLAHLGATALADGRHSFRMVFDTGSVNLDWFFLRRASDACP
jgi:hypothetical protein